MEVSFKTLNPSFLAESFDCLAEGVVSNWCNTKPCGGFRLLDGCEVERSGFPLRWRWAVVTIPFVKLDKAANRFSILWRLGWLGFSALALFTTLRVGLAWRGAAAYASNESDSSASLSSFSGILRSS